MNEIDMKNNNPNNNNLDLNNNSKKLNNCFRENKMQYETIAPTLTFPKEMLQSIDDLCELFEMEREQFITKSIYSYLIYCYETPEVILDTLISSQRIVTLLEKLRLNLNRRFGKEFLHKQYGVKSQIPIVE